MGSGKPPEGRETRSEMTDSRKQKDEAWKGAKAFGLHLEMKGSGQSALSVSWNLGLAGRGGRHPGQNPPTGCPCLTQKKMSLLGSAAWS